jgi:hypothetical protein
MRRCQNRFDISTIPPECASVQQIIQSRRMGPILPRGRRVPLCVCGMVPIGISSRSRSGKLRDYLTGVCEASKVKQVLPLP